jgi:hypothetical protein
VSHEPYRSDQPNPARFLGALRQTHRIQSGPTNARPDGLFSLAACDAYGTIGPTVPFGGSLGPPIRLS